MEPGRLRMTTRGQRLSGNQTGNNPTGSGGCAQRQPLAVLFLLGGGGMVPIACRGGGDGDQDRMLSVWGLKSKSVPIRHHTSIPYIVRYRVACSLRNKKGRRFRRPLLATKSIGERTNGSIADLRSAVNISPGRLVFL